MYTSLSSATPAPGALASATLPARQARIRPRHAEHGVGAEHLGIEEQHRRCAGRSHRRAAQPCDGAHVDAVVVADHQVAALHQFAAHLLRQVGVLEIGGVVDAGRQHHHLGLLDAARATARAACRTAATG